ncbi:ACP S-malonyltransferase [Paenibacillus forsythiae]|nr:ACP S-malonyltransferase [Paenibacillus forsythiae]
MKKPMVFMFSGQGSQSYQMGKELFDLSPVFRHWLRTLDRIASGIIGQSVLAAIYDPQKKKHDVFNRTLLSHPAIFMVEYALAATMLENGFRADYVLGASLGEFASAAVAGVIGPEAALLAVLKQAELIESTCAEGSMLAVLHDAGMYEANSFIRTRSQLAAIHYASNFVLSGEPGDIREIHSRLNEQGVISQLLPVGYAFHSSLIDPAEERYKAYLKNLKLSPPAIPLASCAEGRLLHQLGPGYFWDTVRKQISFADVIRTLEQEGSYIYVDLGPSGSLANFVKRCLGEDSKSECHSVLSSFGTNHHVLESLRLTNVKHSIFFPGRNNEEMTTCVFPGQGSQYKGMGETLFDEFTELTAKAEQILGYSIKTLCLEDPNGQLGRTDFTQPALYVVNALTYLKLLRETGKTPDYVAGHSLGEYNALFAAGAFDFETGLKLVQKRGQLMEKVSGGGMAAIVGLKAEQIHEILVANGLTAIDAANYNSPSQTVVSGPREEIERAQRIFEAAGAALYYPLSVSGAFHSRYMNGVKSEFEDFLKSVQFGELHIPVISNVHARPYKQNEIKQNLLEQITNSVQWCDSIRYLMGKGEVEIIEVGPKDVLKKLVAAIRKEATPIVVEDDPSPEDYIAEPSNQIIAEKELPSTEPTVRAAQVASSDKFRDITPYTLGNAALRSDYNLKYAYMIGSMYKGISSAELVVKAGKSGILGFFGAGGLGLGDIEKAIRTIQQALNNGEPYGMNLLHQPNNPDLEEQVADLYLRYGVRTIEASAFFGITSALVKYRAKGLQRKPDGTVGIANRIIAKVSRPEVAEGFLSPAPARLVEKLLAENKISHEEAQLLKLVPMADALTAEADSGGHTDHGVAYALLPTMIKLRDEMMEKYRYSEMIKLGAAGGIGTPEAGLAAFVLGADYIVTGSINQCTVEAGTSAAAKELLQNANVQDTDYAPAGDMFELGAKIQVLKKGVFFPARANKLYELYNQYNSLDEIGENTKKRIQDRYFRHSFEEVYELVKRYKQPEEIEKAEKNPKYKMALVFKWYFSHSTRLAISGDLDQKVDYQIHCGPALGAFNQWVKGTELENWRNRHADRIGEKLMEEIAEQLRRLVLAYI